MATKDQRDNLNPDEPDDIEEDVDLDLEAEDAELRAEIGKGTAIRLPSTLDGDGGKIPGAVVHFPHMDDWEYQYHRMMVMGNYDGWAQGVLSEDDFQKWQAVNLRNYQIANVVYKVTLAAGTNLGKSGPSSRSSRRKRGK